MNLLRSIPQPVFPKIITFLLKKEGRKAVPLSFPVKSERGTPLSANEQRKLQHPICLVFRLNHIAKEHQHQ